MVTQTENEEVLVEEEVTESDNGSENESEELTEAEIRYLNQKKRAEKAEAELKALRDASQTKPTAKTKESQKPITNDRDETFVISALGSKGLSYEEINTYLDKAKKIATVEDIPLAKVLDTDYFKAFDKSYQDNKKQELASMSASRGSGGNVTKKTIQTPDLSDDDFNAMLKKQILGQ